MGTPTMRRWSLCLVWSRTTIDEILWRTSFQLWHCSWSGKKAPRAQSLGLRQLKQEDWWHLVMKLPKLCWTLTMSLSKPSNWLQRNCGIVTISSARRCLIPTECFYMDESFCFCAKVWNQSSCTCGRSSPSTTAFWICCWKETILQTIGLTEMKILVALWLHWQLFEVAATILTALALVFCRLFEDKPFLTWRTTSLEKKCSCQFFSRRYISSRDISPQN